MIESGGAADKEAFLSDPLQFFNAGDWPSDGKKEKLTGYSKNEEKTPYKSARAGLEWLRYKGWLHNSAGKKVNYLGRFQALRRYNGNPNLKSPYPGVKHRDWYASEITAIYTQMSNR